MATANNTVAVHLAASLGFLLSHDIASLLLILLTGAIALVLCRNNSKLSKRVTSLCLASHGSITTLDFITPSSPTLILVKYGTAIVKGCLVMTGCLVIVHLSSDYSANNRDMVTGILAWLVIASYIALLAMDSFHGVHCCLVRSPLQPHNIVKTDKFKRRKHFIAVYSAVPRRLLVAYGMCTIKSSLMNS